MVICQKEKDNCRSCPVKDLIFICLFTIPAEIVASFLLLLSDRARKGHCASKICNIDIYMYHK